MRRTFVVAAVLAGVADGCGPDLNISQEYRGVIHKYGWREDTELRAEVEKAAGLCNKLLGPEPANLKVRPAWIASQEQDVPIYVVGLKNLTWDDIVFVPPDDRIIVIGRPQLSSFCADRVKSVDDRPRLLAVLLLHELGHIHNGDQGSYGPAAGKNLNTDLTPQKQKEEAADLFAIDRLKIAMADTNNVGRVTASASVSTSLTVFSFNLTSTALLKDFGGRSKSRFWDTGYTHPNLERRILVMLNELSPSEQSAELLRQFDEDRENAGRLRVCAGIRRCAFSTIRVPKSRIRKHRRNDV